MFSDSFGSLADYQKQSAERFHRKMLNTQLAIDTTLETCLAAQTTDALGAMCQFWKTMGYGKKQEKVSRLAGRIMDADVFKGMVNNLGDEERSALRWVLDGGGFRPWGELRRDLAMIWISHLTGNRESLKASWAG